MAKDCFANAYRYSILYDIFKLFDNTMLETKPYYFTSPIKQPYSSNIFFTEPRSDSRPPKMLHGQKLKK